MNMRKRKIAIYIAICACTVFALLFGAFTSFFTGFNLGSSVEAVAEAETDDTQEKKTTSDNLLTLTEEQIHNSQIGTMQAKEGILHIRTSVPSNIVVNPNRYAHVVSNTDAIVQEVKADLGEWVAEGEILGILESREIAEAKANHLAALRREKLTENILAREKELKAKKISPEQDFLNAQIAYEEADIALTLTTQKLLALGLNIDEIQNLPNEDTSTLRLYCLRAPIDGTIIKRHMTKGEVINANEEAFIIANLKTVWVEMKIYPKDLAVVKIGQKVEVTSDQSSKSTIAKIIYLSPILDEDTRTATAIGEIDNSSGVWRPGSFVTANITTNVIKAPIAVRSDAIQNIYGVDTIFVRHEQGFEIRPVKVGRSDGKQTEIVSGLQKGEIYAADNAFALKAELTKADGAEDD